MVDEKQKEINGCHVRVVPLLGSRSFSVHVKLIKYFGKSILQALGAVKDMAQETQKTGKKVDVKSMMNLDIDFTQFSEAIESLAEKSPDELFQFVMEALSSTFINEKVIDKPSFDMHFAGNMVFLYKVLWFTLEANYGDFFAVVGSGTTNQKVPVPTERGSAK